MNDESIKRSSELLLQGATMLQTACPECNNPLYRLKDGTLKCAHCNKRVLLEKDLDEKTRKGMGLSKSPIQSKINMLTDQLEREEDPDKIIKLAETIKKLQEIL